MIMTNAMRAELELMQLCLEGSEENKIEIALEILAIIVTGKQIGRAHV